MFEAYFPPAAAVFPLSEIKALFVSICSTGAPPSQQREQGVSTLPPGFDTAFVRISYPKTVPVPLEDSPEPTHMLPAWNDYV